MNTTVNNEQQTVSAQPAAVETEREYIRPSVNIYETESGYALEAELPGVNKDGLGITLEGGLLTLEGRRSDPGVPGAEPLHRESIPANFRRVFQLDPAIDTAKITARIEQGVLTVTLPKAEESKPRKIAVA
ncbi:MAG: Hsp20/alpha crystallin family protein [Verrucomicrobiota bacterium]|jgi:HSP20 family protein